MRRASGGTEIHRTSIYNNIELSSHVIAKMRGGKLNEWGSKKIFADGSDGIDSWDVQRAVQRMRHGARADV